MELALLLGLSFVCGAGVLALLRHFDRHRLDKAGTVVLLLFPLAGALAILPGFLFYAAAGILLPLKTGAWDDVLFIWAVNAPGEELAKYAAFVLFSTLLKSLREPQDGLLQGAATGLGFGLVENFLYGLADGWETLVLRSFFSLPGHIVYGAVWGAYHGFEVYQGSGRVVRWWIPLLALVPAVFAHAMFNTLVLVDAPLVLALAADGLTLGFGLFLYFRLRDLSPARLRRPLKDWPLAIPETEHALVLNPGSEVLRRRLAAYLLAAAQPGRALSVLEGLPDDPWTLFYRAAALRALDPSFSGLPPEAVLDPRLFRRLSGG